MTNLLEVKNLRVSFDLLDGQLEAVKGVSFRIQQGKTVALVGESGSGKSVISQSIMGILPNKAHITEGEILFYDPETQPDKSGAIKPINIASLPPKSQSMRDIQGGRISIIFQEPMTSLSPLHTIGNQIIEAVCLHRSCSGETARQLAEDMLQMVGFPDPKRALDTYPFELSGGLRQRAMIAMALVCHPALLIADEPTTALDVTIQAQILSLIKNLQTELGMAVLMITHDLGVVANMADEVVVLYHGEVMEYAPIKDIYENPQHPYLQALLKAVPRFHMNPGEKLIPIREIKSKDDRIKHADRMRTKLMDIKHPILEVKNIEKSFIIRKQSMKFGQTSEAAIQKVHAVKDLSFSVNYGECLGLVGESGCGKTTTSKILMRAMTPDQGEITYYDRGQPIDLLAMENHDLMDFRTKMQFIFQDPFSSLNPRMNIEEILTEPLIIHNIGTPKERIENARELLRLVGLDDRHLKRYPHSFSGGQRQRIGIARALALKPDLLICDEPVSALDVSIQAQILNFLKELKAKLGLSYIFISHNLAVVDYIADRIAVMCRGRLVEVAPRQILFNNPVHPYTKRLLAAVPEPSLEHRLDMAQLIEEKASDPNLWEQPFNDPDDDNLEQPHLVDLGDGHWVRLNINQLGRDGLKTYQNVA